MVKAVQARATLWEKGTHGLIIAQHNTHASRLTTPWSESAQPCPDERCCQASKSCSSLLHTCRSASTQSPSRLPQPLQAVELVAVLSCRPQDMILGCVYACGGGGLLGSLQETGAACLCARIYQSQASCPLQATRDGLYTPMTR